LGEKGTYLSLENSCPGKEGGIKKTPDGNCLEKRGGRPGDKMGREKWIPRDLSATRF